MVCINDTWFEVYDLQDISKIIRENYNYDLADELDKLIPNHTDEEYYNIDSALADAILDINADKELIDSLDERIRDLEDEINQLNEEKDELKERLRKYKSR